MVARIAYNGSNPLSKLTGALAPSYNPRTNGRTRTLIFYILGEMVQQRKTPTNLLLIHYPVLLFVV